MTRRHQMLRVAVGTNALCVAINVAAVGWDLWMVNGHLYLLPMLAVLIGVAAIYTLVVRDDRETAHEALAAADLRSHEALAAMHEDMLTKVRGGHVEIGVDVGESERRH